MKRERERERELRKGVRDPSSSIQSITIGEDTKIWQFCVVLAGAVIGKNCNINSHCFIENDVIIGDNVTVKCGVQLWDGLRVEDDVFIGPNVTFTNDMYPRSKHFPPEFLKTTIKRGASIGANATILCGISIGEYALIGAGSVVTKDVPAHTLWHGNPARLQRHICRCGGRVDEKGVCLECKAVVERAPDAHDEWV